MPLGQDVLARAGMGGRQRQRGPAVMSRRGGWVPPDHPDAVPDPMQEMQPQGQQDAPTPPPQNTPPPGASDISGGDPWGNATKPWQEGYQGPPPPPPPDQEQLQRQREMDLQQKQSAMGAGLGGPQLAKQTPWQSTLGQFFHRAAQPPAPPVNPQGDPSGLSGAQLPPNQAMWAGAMGAGSAMAPMQGGNAANAADWGGRPVDASMIQPPPAPPPPDGGQPQGAMGQPMGQPMQPMLRGRPMGGGRLGSLVRPRQPGQF